MYTELIEAAEGYREKAYYCTEGYPTIGIGAKLGPKGAPLEHYTLSVGRQAAKALLEQEINEILKAICNTKWFSNCNAERRAVIVSMAYQMGTAGLLKFKKMIAAIESRNWVEAERQALDSRWARQTERRAKHHARVLRTGIMEKL